MPIIAVAGAIGAAVVAGVDVAAVGLTVATAFEVTAAVGATIGAIGAVTGDKTLSMVGLGLGAVGGVGALASSAGLLGDTSASLFGATPTSAASGSFAESLTPATAGAAGDVTQAAIDTGAFDSTMGGIQAAGAEAGAGVADASQGTIDFLSGQAAAAAPGDVAPPANASLGSVSQNAADPNAALMNLGEAPTGADATSTALLNTPPSTTGIPGLANSTNNIGTDISASPGADFSFNGQPSTSGPVSDASGASGLPATGSAAPASATAKSVADVAGTFDSPLSGDSGIGGIFGKIVTYAGDHPVVALGALQAGGSLLQGLTSTLTPAQVNALNAQAAANQAVANMATQQQQNLAAPKAVATSSPVTGTPGPLITQGPTAPPPTVPQMPVGLMNQPPRLAPVTGAPA